MLAFAIVCILDVGNRISGHDYHDCYPPRRQPPRKELPISAAPLPLPLASQLSTAKSWLIFIVTTTRQTGSSMLWMPLSRVESQPRFILAPSTTLLWPRKVRLINSPPPPSLPRRPRAFRKPLRSSPPTLAFKATSPPSRTSRRPTRPRCTTLKARSAIPRSPRIFVTRSQPSKSSFSRATPTFARASMSGPRTHSPKS